MTDPVGVTADPRKVLMMCDEPDTVAELMGAVDLAARYASWAGADEYRISTFRANVEAAIRAALEAQP